MGVADNALGFATADRLDKKDHSPTSLRRSIAKIRCKTLKG